MHLIHLSYAYTVLFTNSKRFHFKIARKYPDFLAVFNENQHKPDRAGQQPKTSRPRDFYNCCRFHNFGCCKNAWKRPHIRLALID